jgi:Raf kinase inhibitor-like YbhB/YbcL family protein
LICEDPDAPKGIWSHWLIFDLPAGLPGLSEGVVSAEQVEVSLNGDLALQGKNDFGKLGYGGPCPPKGSHRYQFKLFALDDRLGLGAKTTRQDLLRAMKGHVLAEGMLTGVYSR